MRHPLGHHAHRRPTDGAPTERGIIVLLTALCLVSVLLMATIVVDGSLAYTQRRSMQNAADVSALAGARQLDKVKYSGAAWTTVNATASSAASTNGADAITCTVISGTGASLGACSSQAAVLAASAAGVEVRAEHTRRTTFGKLSGRDGVTARASAAATIQTLTGTATPFVICGNPANGGYPILKPDNTIDVAAATAMGTIDVQAAQVPTCGAGAAFKGKIGDTDPIVVPGWVSGDNGNGYEQEIHNDVLGATPCPTGGPFDGCDMLIPIADTGVGNGNAIDMHVVAWAVFHITGDGHGNPKYRGTFRSDVAYVSGGQTSTSLPPNASTPRVVRLTR